ncbi:hypothetical protein KSS87_013011 [Heliosperma pusillum]|nr:hypothetical protein KSS87_013011 [Heliosperma pusillum]
MRRKDGGVCGRRKEEEAGDRKKEGRCGGGRRRPEVRPVEAGVWWRQGTGEGRPALGEAGGGGCGRRWSDLVEAGGCLMEAVWQAVGGGGRGGDKFLKPIVISEPEITITRRDPKDECIILASDGFWDVIPNHIACKVALQGLQETKIAIDDLLDAACKSLDEECPTLSARVAALLTCLALGKDSTDNISVIVVDLKSR